MRRVSCSKNQGEHCAGSDDDHCHAPDCTLFDEVVCKGSVGVANSCQWGDFSCEPLKCSNQASLSTEETCNESSGVGPCKWSTAFNGCQAFSCSDYTKEADCNADASKVLPMTFLLGAAPYGKTPCVWKGSSCSQIYQCAEYDNEGLCQADPAGFGKCEWHSDVSKCTDMITCSAYSSQGACETDTYKAAQRTHPSAKCWWSPNGECADNAPGLMDYLDGPECDERVDQTTCELATEVSAAWKHTSLTKMIGILFFAVAWSVGA